MRIRLRRYALVTLVLVLFLIGGWFVLPRRSPTTALPFSTNGFTSTTLPTGGLPPNSSLIQIVGYHWMEFILLFRTHHPNPNAWSFPPDSTGGSVHGLLNQCMQVSSVRYLIIPEVAGGSVHFTHTNTLNGSRWVAAVEQELKTGKVEWWDAKNRGMRIENLALINYSAQNTTVVLPLSQAKDFEEKYPTNNLSASDNASGRTQSGHL
jgi:hypothetical protein